MWLKCLMTWLCPPKPTKLSERQQLCLHVLSHRQVIPISEGITVCDGVGWVCQRCRVSPRLFRVAQLLVETDGAAVVMPAGNVAFCGVELISDPTVTEFTAR